MCIPYLFHGLVQVRRPPRVLFQLCSSFIFFFPTSFCLLTPSVISTLFVFPTLSIFVSLSRCSRTSVVWSCVGICGSLAHKVQSLVA